MTEQFPMFLIHLKDCSFNKCYYTSGPAEILYSAGVIGLYSFIIFCLIVGIKWILYFFQAMYLKAQVSVKVMYAVCTHPLTVCFLEGNFEI